MGPSLLVGASPLVDEGGWQPPVMVRTAEEQRLIAEELAKAPRKPSEGLPSCDNVADFGCCVAAVPEVVKWWETNDWQEKLGLLPASSPQPEGSSSQLGHVHVDRRASSAASARLDAVANAITRQLVQVTEQPPSLAQTTVI
jgi:hypothetical protein